MRVLVAEDEATSCAVLTSVLSKWGFDVCAVADGYSALEELQRPGSPKLAILDRRMPGLDGLEVCRRLRQSESSLPRYIILLTAMDSREDIVDGLGAGADDYVVKPFDVDEFGARVRVGRRVIELQAAAVEREKLNGVVEMAGAVCHELNQPLQVISSAAELLLLELEEDSPQYSDVRLIRKHMSRMGDLTRKLMAITDYRTRDYLSGKIIDIHSMPEAGTVDLNPQRGG